MAIIPNDGQMSAVDRESAVAIIFIVVIAVVFTIWGEGRRSGEKVTAHHGRHPKIPNLVRGGGDGGSTGVMSASSNRINNTY